VAWDFGGGGYCCPECGTPFTGLGSDHVREQLDWLVIVRVRADCRRRYRRACSCRVPATVTAPGPPKAIGKGLFTNAFIAMLFTERFVAGRSMNSLVTGLARHGADVAPGTLAGACAQAGALLAPLEDAITARSRRSWHLHADETTWRVFAPRDGDGPARWWLWVFPGADTACFVMDATRSGAVLARHAGIDEKTGQLTPDDDDGEPRRLVISSDFYAVYQSAGKKAGGLVNLYCRAHIRRYFVRAGDANPAQLGYWTAAWLERVRDLYAAHAQRTPAAISARSAASAPAAARRSRLPWFWPGSTSSATTSVPGPGGPPRSPGRRRQRVPGGPMPVTTTPGKGAPQPFPARPAVVRPLRAFLDLGVVLTAPGCARSWTREILWEWGAAELAESAELVASELVTSSVNACIGLGQADIRLILTLGEGELAVLVRDSHPGAPLTGQPGADDEAAGAAC
jgi:transposase